MDSAVAGEAAGYAMGLVMLGTGSPKALEEMLQYAHETQHEKIIRGLAVGISFLVYGLQEKADGIVDTLISDKVGGMSFHCLTRTNWALGPYFEIRWNSCPRLGARWYGQQRRHSKTFTCSSLGCQR